MASFGTVYRRNKVWWIQYCYRGQVFRESSGSDSKRDALSMLRNRVGEIGPGARARLQSAETSFEELAAMMERDYAVHGRKSAADLSYRIGHLRPHFGRWPASEITHERMVRYIVDRKADGAAPATIQHELACLSKMLTLALRSSRLATKPPIPTITLRNARTGFFDADEVERVIRFLPQPIGDVVRFAYLTGWRKSEVLGLQWRSVEPTSVRLDPGTTKNDEGRVFPMTDPLAALLDDRRRLTRDMERTRSQVSLAHFRGRFDYAA